MERNDKFDNLARLYANLGKLITASMDFDEILKGIMQELQIYFQPQHWSMLRYDPLTRQLFFAVIEGEDLEKYEDFRLSLGEGIAGYVAETREPLLVEDAYSDPRFESKVDRETGFKTRSIIAVPCIHRGRLFGVFELINHDKIRQFNSTDLSILHSIADFSAIAFANAESYELALMKSRIDPLTGAYNHSMLSEIMYDGPDRNPGRRRDDILNDDVLVLYLDVDEFKEINDNFGHAEGDIVLKTIVAHLKQQFRKEDYIIRTGGDEFVVVMSAEGSTMEEITGIIENRMNRISELFQHKEYTPGISYGLSCGRRENIRDLIQEADGNMYRAKKSRKSGDNS